ncbi:MAG: SDR family NAD(P)-dependent oxidoreductase, partial [Bradyrhizobium sp.]
MSVDSRAPALFDLTGKIAIVTGGNGGIGLGMAKGLAEAGAAIVVAARDAAKSEAAVKELIALGAEAAFIAVDVTDAGSCRVLIEATVARFGKLDILVNNAGINIRKVPENYSAEEWHRVLDINLTGSFLCSQAAYPALC